MEGASMTSLLEHLDVLQVIFLAGFTFVVWSAKKTFEEFQNSISDLYRKYNTLHEDFYRLQGEHNAIRQSTANCYGCYVHKRKTDEFDDLESHQ